MIDQMYQISNGPMGTNALLQNIDILGDCGNYDHGIALYSNGYTYNTQTLSSEEFQKYHATSTE